MHRASSASYRRALALAIAVHAVAAWCWIGFHPTSAHRMVPIEAMAVRFIPAPVTEFSEPAAFRRIESPLDRSDVARNPAPARAADANSLPQVAARKPVPAGQRPALAWAFPGEIVVRVPESEIDAGPSRAVLILALDESGRLTSVHSEGGALPKAFEEALQPVLRETRFSAASADGDSLAPSRLRVQARFEPDQLVR